jgi:GH25 family lysozyme M1 (1,4-beta-N-acetylmuramidase)
LNNEENAGYPIVIISDGPHGTALLHVLEHRRLKGTDRFEGKEVMMEFLGKKRKIAKREHGVDVSEKARSIDFRKKIKQQATGDVIRLNSALSCHPVVPVRYL